jgi:hypothetical protein
MAIHSQLIGRGDTNDTGAYYYYSHRYFLGLRQELCASQGHDFFTSALAIRGQVRVCVRKIPQKMGFSREARVIESNGFAGIAPAPSISNHKPVQPRCCNCERRSDERIGFKT